jgi:hypothetical protein
MRHWVLAAGFLTCAAVGCASTDSGKSSWDEVKKDLRGDNMQMRSNFATSSDNGDMGGSLKPKGF